MRWESRYSNLDKIYWYFDGKQTNNLDDKWAYYHKNNITYSTKITSEYGMRFISSVQDHKDVIFSRLNHESYKYCQANAKMANLQKHHFEVLVFEAFELLSEIDFQCEFRDFKPVIIWRLDVWPNDFSSHSNVSIEFMRDKELEYFR